MFAVILPLPKDETEQKAIVKDPQKFMAKKVAKGCRGVLARRQKGAEINAIMWCGLQLAMCHTRG